MCICDNNLLTYLFLYTQLIMSFCQVFSYFNNEISDVLLTLVIWHGIHFITLLTAFLLCITINSSQIRQERDGCNVDMDLLMGIMRGICRSEVKTKLKSAVIQDTYLYYSRKSYEWIVQYPLQDYLAKVTYFNRTT